MFQLPDSWSDWILERTIGEGSYGTVYEAVRKDDPSIRAAIKVIPIPQDPSEVQELYSQGFDTAQAKEFFDQAAAELIREVKVMECFKGTQNIVSIEDYRVEPREDGIGSHILIRMELLTSLDCYISDKKLTEEEVAQIGIDLCNALSLCMSRNIVHRDIKPENIFVNDRLGTHVFFKLGDFGVARTMENRTTGMSVRGTPNYIAPEVMLGHPYDTRADIYSLGLTLYRLLNNNRLPFFPQTDLYSPTAKREAVMRRTGGDPLDPPVNASPEIAAVILKACAFLPENRYRTADEMKQALKTALEKKTAGASDSIRPAVPKKTHRWLFAVIAAAVLLLAAAVWSLWQNGKRTQAPSPAPSATESAGSTSAGTRAPAAPLGIAVQPAPQTVSAGEEVTFSVTPEGGSGDYGYHWYLASSTTALGSTVSREQTCTLPAKTIHNGFYVYCIVSSGNKSVTSSRAKLTVISKMTILTQPVSVTAEEGTTVTFSVAAEGGEDYGYHWYLASDAAAVGSTVGSEQTCSLTARAIHDGFYVYCIVTSGCDSVTSARARLTVVPVPDPAAQTTSAPAAVPPGS